MRNMSGIMSALHLLSEWFVRFVVVNLLWFIINLPLAIVVLNLVMSETERIIYVLPISVLGVVLFFPSTMALFAVVRDWLMKEIKNQNLKRFLKYFKKDYLRSVFSGVVWTVIWLVWYVDLIYFNQENSFIAFIIVIIGIMLFVANINFFSLSVHYHMKMKELLKNSFFVTIGNPILFFIVLMVYGILLFIGISYPMFTFPLFIASVSAFISFLAFYRFTLRLKEGDSKAS